MYWPCKSMEAVAVMPVTFLPADSALRHHSGLQDCWAKTVWCRTAAMYALSVLYLCKYCQFTPSRTCCLLVALRVRAVCFAGAADGSMLLCCCSYLIAQSLQRTCLTQQQCNLLASPAWQGSTSGQHVVCDADLQVLPFDTYKTFACFSHNIDCSACVLVCVTVQPFPHMLRVPAQLGHCCQREFVTVDGVLGTVLPVRLQR